MGRVLWNKIYGLYRHRTDRVIPPISFFKQLKSGLCNNHRRLCRKCNLRPRLDAAEKIAKALNITTDELLGNADMLVAQAAEKYGARGAKQAKQLTEEVTGLFAGGDMAEEDMDLMMKAIQDAYWIAKQNNKKFTPKKHRPE